MTPRSIRCREAGLHRVRWLCHFTYAHLLPDIAASNGLLSANERTTPPAHGWGRNRDLGDDFVCTSWIPNWGILGAMNGLEAALLLIDPEQALDSSSTCFVPLNSARSEARRYMTGDVDFEIAIRESGQNLKRAEVLVRNRVPLSSIAGVLFHSEGTRDRWWKPFVDTCRGSSAKLGGWYQGELGSPQGFRFPTDYVCVLDRSPVSAAGKDRSGSRADVNDTNAFWAHYDCGPAAPDSTLHQAHPAPLARFGSDEIYGEDADLEGFEGPDSESAERTSTAGAVWEIPEGIVEEDWLDDEPYADDEPPDRHDEDGWDVSQLEDSGWIEDDDAQAGDAASYLNWLEAEDD